MNSKGRFRALAFYFFVVLPYLGAAWGGAGPDPFPQVLYELEVDGVEGFQPRWVKRLQLFHCEIQFVERRWLFCMGRNFVLLPLFLSGRTHRGFWWTDMPTWRSLLASRRNSTIQSWVSTSLSKSEMSTAGSCWTWPWRGVCTVSNAHVRLWRR